MEKKFTSEEKIAIYKKALESLINDNSLLFGLCWHISVACYRIHKIEETAYYEGMGLNYPEIEKYKPNGFDKSKKSYWFPCNEVGMKKRAEILKKAIAKLEKAPKTNLK